MIYLIRHGETEFNREGRFQGQLDSPLTTRGRAQAARIAERLGAVIDDLAACDIVASPLGRAVHTATIIADALGLPAPATDVRLGEIGMGSWDGLTTEDIALGWPGAAEGATRYTIFFESPDGEAYDVFAARLRSWLDEAAADPRPRIAVSHGVAGRVLRGLYLGQEKREFLSLPAPQDAFFRLADGRIEQIDCDPVALASERPGR